jgi:hypothetical protein
MGAQDSKAAFAAAIAALESALSRLRDDYGESLGVRRLAADVRRLSDDLADLGDPLPGHPPADNHDLEEIPDVPYDRSMWQDAEDEGFGAPDRHAP